MTDVNEVADNIFQLETSIDGVKNSFSVYLIRGSKGVLIEPGPAITLPLIQEAMKQLGMKSLAYIIPTHIHVDHAGGTGALSGIFPEAMVLVHPRGRKHLIDPSRLMASTKTVWGDNFEERFGPVLPVPESRVNTPEDGEIVSIDGRELQMIYAPGHAPHHMAVFDKKSRALFCGEALGLLGKSPYPFPLPAVAPPHFEQDLYLETMDKLRRIRPDILLFSHGGAVSNPEEIIAIAEENARDFGDMILKALRNGEKPEEIGERFRDYAVNRFGRELDETDLKMTVGGYAIYFKSKGLV